MSPPDSRTNWNPTTGLSPTDNPLPEPSAHDPRLVYETHMHTTLCRHASGSVADYAEVAIERGLAGITVTCHCPMPDGHSANIRMAEDEFDDYLTLVADARAAFAGRLDIRLGLEADYFPGYESWIEALLWRADFDYVLGSVHPHLPEYREAYWMGDTVAFQHCYFEHLAQAAETGLFDSLAHPDLVKNLVGDEWHPGKMLHHLGGYLDRIAKTGVAMELNTSGRYKTVPEMNPGPAILRAMRQRSIPVTVGADAHQPERVGEGFLEAYGLLEEAGYSDVSFFSRRSRYDETIADCRSSMLAADLELDGLQRVTA